MAQFFFVYRRKRTIACGLYRFKVLEGFMWRANGVQGIICTQSVCQNKDEVAIYI